METNPSITQFQPGGMKELVSISLPLMIVSLSENIMIFFDRIILSHYSLLALNSATLASQAIEIFQHGLCAITGLSEMVVASLFARKALAEMAKPCWQMIYLSLFSLPFIFILSRYTGSLVLPMPYQPTGLGYYQILMYSVPLVGLVGALAGFFVGQGRVKLILYSTIAVNIVNLILDFILIFGIKNIIPAMGAAGAAISAIISLLIQVFWLFTVFLSKHHRFHFKTHVAVFNIKYFLKCIKVGLPIALSHACELLGWLFIIKVISGTGLKNFTIISIGSTLYLMYAFLNDGLYRALSSIISHHISANNIMSIHKTLYNGLILLLFFLLLFAIPFLLAPNLIINLFNLKDYAVPWHHDIKTSFIFIWCYFLFSGIYWVFAAILTARYHTKFIMISNVASIWLTTALPIYILVNYYTLPSSFIWPIMCIYVLLGGIGIFIYYKINNFRLQKAANQQRLKAA